MHVIVGDLHDDATKQQVIATVSSMLSEGQITILDDAGNSIDVSEVGDTLRLWSDIGSNELVLALAGLLERLGVRFRVGVHGTEREDGVSVLSTPELGQCRTLTSHDHTLTDGLLSVKALVEDILPTVLAPESDTDAIRREVYGEIRMKLARAVGYDHLDAIEHLSRPVQTNHVVENSDQRATARKSWSSAGSAHRTKAPTWQGVL